LFSNLAGLGCVRRYGLCLFWHPPIFAKPSLRILSIVISCCPKDREFCLCPSSQLGGADGGWVGQMEGGWWARAMGSRATGILASNHSEELTGPTIVYIFSSKNICRRPTANDRIISIPDKSIHRLRSMGPWSHWGLGPLPIGPIEPGCRADRARWGQADGRFGTFAFYRTEHIHTS
jgi:hypothetical protein